MYIAKQKQTQQIKKNKLVATSEDRESGSGNIVVWN